jgi:hypothetical protein
MTGIELGVIAGTAVTLGDAALVAGTLVTALSAIQQGRAAKKAGDRNAAVAARNAEIARANGAANAEAERKDVARRIGAQVAGYGASGVAFEGTPLDVLGETAENGEKDVQNILYQAELRAIGFNDESSFQQFKGNQAQTAGFFGAGGALLKGVGDYGEKKSASKDLTTNDTPSGPNPYANTGPF